MSRYQEYFYQPSESFKYEEYVYQPSSNVEYYYYSQDGSSSNFSFGSASSSSAAASGSSAVLAHSGSSNQANAGSAADANAVAQQVTVDLLQLAASSVSAAAGSNAQSSGASGSGASVYGASGSGASGSGAAGVFSQSVGLSFGGANSGFLESSAYSKVEQAILSASNPPEFDEYDVITVNGHSGVWTNKKEVVNWRGALPITQYLINQDENPEVIRKRTEQQVLYEQEIAVRYLRPPTPPPPGEILIRQEKNIVTPPAPPLVIRQQPPRPETPPPLVVREAPPRPPAAVGQKVVTISGKRLPPPPRKVVIERLAPLPSKPQSVIIERWLPYKDQKRRVIFTRPSEPDPVIPRPRNVIVQWEAPQVVIKREFRDLGVIRANPVEYVQRYGASLKSHVELPQFVKEIRPPTGVVLAAEHLSSAVHDLEGDVHALALIDLEGEGLSQYRSYLTQYAFSSSSGAGAGGAGAGGAGAGGAGAGGAGAGGAGAGGAGAGGASSVFLNNFQAVSGGSTSVSISQSSSASGSGASLNDLINEAFANVDKNSDGRISYVEAGRVLLTLNSRLGRRYGEDEAQLFFRALDVNNDGSIDHEEFRNALLRRYVV